MSVGKESIKRAASAGAKKTAAKTAEVKPAEVKAEVPKTARKPAARKTAAKSTRSVKTSVLTPANSKEIQTKFISDKTKQPANTPVHISEELPVYLL